jgi:hypothetical protein
MKLCIDCKHYGGVAPRNGEYICNEPRNQAIHPVDGLPRNLRDAFQMRRAIGVDACGMEGKWWEKKGDSPK